MNKTVNINLGNRIFAIEEEAYLMLDEYLTSLRIHFAPQDPDGEIVNDIEQRLSELFEEKKRLGYQVMTTEITKNVIGRLGETSEIFDETGEEGASQYSDESKAHEPNNTTSGENRGRASHNSSSTDEQGVPTRKLFRDIDRKWISGVCAGIAAYTDTPLFFIRLVMIILLLSPANLIALCLYLAMTLFVDPAITANDKLLMQGRMISPGTLWNKISEKSAAIADDISDDMKPGQDSKFSDTIKHAWGELGKSLKKINWNYWLWLIFAIVVFFIALLGLLYWINPAFMYEIASRLPFSSVSVFGHSYTWPINIAWFMIPFGIIVGIMFFVALAAILILPIGVILKTPYKPTTKLVLILMWIILMSVVFAAT